MIAVITGDLVESSHYNERDLNLVLDTLNKQFKSISTHPAGAENFKIYRGDSFQGVIKQPQMALQIALQFKAAIKKVPLNSSENSATDLRQADVKLAIGIGSFDFERESIAESNGQAFQLSGRTLDEMKYEIRKIRLATPNESINSEFNASLFLLDTILDKWTRASAEVIYYMLKGKKEREIATKLNISQSAVNQRKKTAGWDPIAVLLNRYEKAISQSFLNG